MADIKNSHTPPLKKIDVADTMDSTHLRISFQIFTRIATYIFNV